MKTKRLHLSDIVTTTGTQIRARIDGETVDQYAEAMRDDSNTFPPVVAFHDGSQFILADGFHRVMAASRNGFKDIEADVQKGTKSDALKYALGANSTHGLKRTNADKRRSVEMALSEWPKLSDREIARICSVSNEMVGDVRKSQLSDSDSSHKCKGCGADIDSRAAHFGGQCLDCHTANPPTRIGADGKERKLPTKPVQDIKAASKPSPAPEPAQDEPTAPEPPEDDLAKRQALNEIATTQYSLSILKTAVQNGTGDRDSYMATAMRLRKAANALETFAKGV